MQIYILQVSDLPQNRYRGDWRRAELEFHDKMQNFGGLLEILEFSSDVVKISAMEELGYSM